MNKMVAIALLTLLLTGCGKVNRSNFQQVKVGMSYDEVSLILGKATSCDDLLGTTRCIWGDDSKHIKVHFIADRATLFTSQGIN